MDIDKKKRVLEAAVDGEMGAFREIYDHYLDDVKAVVAKYVGSGADIRDVVQKVFVEVYKSLDSVVNAKKLGPWIRQVARNTAISHYRKHSKSVDFVPLENLKSDRDEWAKLKAREKVRALYAALDLLPDKKRQAVVMYEIEGLKLRQIAEKTGTSINTIGSRVRRGREKLAEIIRRILDSSADVAEEVSQ